jgi:hypothetical protein
MDLWDTPLPTSCLHNFPSKDEDAKCYTFDSDTSDTASATATDTDSSVDMYNNNDTYSKFNPIRPHPVLSLTQVTTSMQLVGLDESSSFPFVAMASKANRSGERRAYRHRRQF